MKLSFEVNGEQLEEDKTYVNDLFLKKDFVPLDMKAVISNYHQKEKEFLKREEDVIDEEEDVENERRGKRLRERGINDMVR